MHALDRWAMECCPLSILYQLCATLRFPLSFAVDSSGPKSCWYLKSWCDTHQQQRGSHRCPSDLGDRESRWILGSPWWYGNTLSRWKAVTVDVWTCDSHKQYLILAYYNLVSINVIVYEVASNFTFMEVVSEWSSKISGCTNPCKMIRGSHKKDTGYAMIYCIDDYKIMQKDRRLTNFANSFSENHEFWPLLICMLYTAR